MAGVNLKKFDEVVDHHRKWRGVDTNPRFFTYLAKSSVEEGVYKIGFSRNPIAREKTMKGGYKYYKFKVTHFIVGTSEYMVLNALFSAGVKTPLWINPKSPRYREAVYLSDGEVAHIIEKCGFIPIERLEEIKNHCCPNGND